LNTNATDEFLKYDGVRKEQTNPFDRNYIFLKVGYYYTDKTTKFKYFGHIKRLEGLEKRIMEGYIPGRRKKEQLKRGWVQDMTDELQMSASDAGNLAYDLAVFKWVLNGAKFLQGHATE
jgi:hypothetical protein